MRILLTFLCISVAASTLQSQECILAVENRWRGIDRAAAVADLKTWLQEKHNANLSAVDFRVDRHGGVGVFAAEDLDREVVAMSVTNQTSIGMEDFLVGPKFRLTRIASGLHDPEEGHSLSMRLFLTIMVEAFYTKDAYAKRWFDSLPRPSDLTGHPAYFNESLRRLASLTPQLQREIIVQQRQLQATYQSSYNHMLWANSWLFGNDTEDNQCIWKEQMRWAMIQFWSRSWGGCKVPSAAAHTTFEGCFIPGMDLVNHQRGDERMLSSRDGNITLRHTISTARPVAKGEELFITYGNEKCNSGMLVGYGFVARDNPDHDCAHVLLKQSFGAWPHLLTLLPSEATDSVRGTVERIIGAPVHATNGSETSRFFLINSRGISRDLVKVARTSCVDKRDLQARSPSNEEVGWASAAQAVLNSVESDEVVSDGNEACAVGRVLEAFVRAKEDYRRARSAAITSELLPADEEAWSFNQANIMEVHEGAMRVIEAAISTVQSAFSLASV